MRLIDADALKKVFERYLNAPHVRFFEEMAVAIDTCNRFLDNAKTIDAVPVVRCGECKHYKATNSKNGRKVCYKHLLTPHPMLPDEFCSRGERKDGVEL